MISGKMEACEPGVIIQVILKIVFHFILFLKSLDADDFDRGKEAFSIKCKKEY